MQDSIAKEKKWGKNVLQLCPLLREGGGGSPTPNGEIQPKYP